MEYYQLADTGITELGTPTKTEGAKSYRADARIQGDIELAHGDMEGGTTGGILYMSRTPRHHPEDKFRRISAGICRCLRPGVQTVTPQPFDTLMFDKRMGYM